MGKFTEDFDVLEASVDRVAAFKANMEDAIEEAKRATDAYNAAVKEAEAIQSDLTRKLSGLLPAVTTSTRVRSA